MDFDIVEWNNPLSADYSTEGFRSISAQFEDFLERSGKFGALTLRETSSTDAINPASNLPDVLLQRKKVILLEEFPNVFSRTSSALLSFRSNVLHYLAATTPSPEDFFNIKQEVEESAVPLIMIISETRPTSTTSSTDSFTAHRILGPNILNHPGTTIIEFNPIAPTIITKALQLVAQKEARRSGRKGGPHNAVLKKLGEVGDIRSAIYSLEFLCLGKASDVNWSDLSSAKNKKVGKETPSKAKNEQESIETITQREASLGIFHAVGRVVYNKREECKPSDLHTGVPVQPPDHQQHHNRPMVSTVKVDDLMDETGTDTATFIAALHENYAPSCDSPTSTDALNGCIDALSDSDLLSPDRSTGFSLQEGFNRGIYAGSGSESLRQNEICFHVAVRGILFALPHPVKRRMPGSIGAGRAPGRADAFKMYYPTSLRLWKRREEIEGLIERWSDPLNDPAAQKGRSEGVDTWKKRVSVSAVQASSPVKADAPTTRPLLMGGDSARTEMILERLPYIAKIERSRHSRGSVYRELEKITTFHGIGGPTDVEPDEEDEPTVPTSNVPVFTQKSRGTEKGFADLSASQNESALEKLVISDDDIEDC
jgi:cell cycle checkpoint protein